MSTSRSIVIAIDDSEHSELAFDFYMNNVYKQGDRIVLVHVPEYGDLITTSSLLTDPNIVQDLLRESEEKTNGLVDKYSKKMKERHLSGHVKQHYGKPGEAIIEATKVEGASMLILGSRGKGLVRRTFLGSNASTGRCIVIAVDDSEHSELAVDFYVNNVYKQGDRIVPVHVPEYGNLITTCSLLTDPNIVQDLLKESEEKTKELMDKYSKKMKERHLSGHVKQRCGKPGEAIIEATKDKGASMLILGSRGKGLVRRTFLGSLVTTVYTIAMFRS